MQPRHPAPIRRKHASAGDHDQAAAHADLLTALIAEARQRAAELEDSATRAHRHGRQKVAYRLYRQGSAVRREITELHQMLERLLCRFPHAELEGCSAPDERRTTQR